MIRCVVLASIGLHVAVFAALPAGRPSSRPPELPSLVELANEPPPKPKQEPPEPEPASTPTARPMLANRAPLALIAHPAATATAIAPTTDAPTAGVDGDGPADFTASVISNAGPGSASRVVVPAPATPSAPKEPPIVPVASLLRRPGAPGLDAELEKNYPLAARRSGISGNAKLRVRILADGRVGRVERISESYEGFGEACARTVRGARWEPPLDEDGRAVATEIVYVCKFEVRS
jgi:periplasmic protein TonB